MRSWENSHKSEGGNSSHYFHCLHSRWEILEEDEAQTESHHKENQSHFTYTYCAHFTVPLCQDQSISPQFPPLCGCVEIYSIYCIWRHFLCVIYRCGSVCWRLIWKWLISSIIENSSKTLWWICFASHSSSSHGAMQREFMWARKSWGAEISSTVSFHKPINPMFNAATD